MKVQLPSAKGGNTSKVPSELGHSAGGLLPHPWGLVTKADAECFRGDQAWLLALSGVTGQACSGR